MRWWLLAVLVVFALPASASAQRSRYVDTFVDQTGDPRLEWPLYADQRVVEVRTCAGETCAPLPEGAYERASYDGRASGVHPGLTPVGTVFEVEFEDPAGRATVRTPPWQGRVTKLHPPRVVGPPTVGQKVSLAGGTWAGGWDGPKTGHAQMIMCRTATREDCWHPAQETLAQRWAGWYMLAYDAPWRTHNSWTVYDTFGFVNHHVDVAEHPLVAYSVPLLVCCVLPAPAPPTASLRKRAVRSHGRLLLGKVECAVRCTVGLTVSGGGSTLTRTRSVEGPAALSIPVRRGRLRVQVRIDGKVVARRWTVAR